MISNNFDIDKLSSTILISKHNDNQVVEEINNIIKTNIKDEEACKNYNFNKYREIILEVQNILNNKSFATNICKKIFSDLTIYLGTISFLVQSNLYLRASRPVENSKKYDSESIGFHRESFYGENMGKSVNIWTPIKGVNKDNTLRYVPNSQLIPDDIIETHKTGDNYTQQYSNGHKLGFQYQPKKISGGVDFSNIKKMEVPYGFSSIFSGDLIHGSANNDSNNIRFSCDFRVIRKSDYSSKNKDFHFASNKPYFIDFEID